MKGYVARKGNRWYAVIYDGLDPVTGRERRSWHPAGTNRDEAERLALQLAASLNGRDDEARALSFGAYLTTRWLPGKRLALRVTTWDGYRRKIDRHILPTLGRVPIRRLRPAQLEALYDSMLHPTDGRRALSPKTVLEVHLSSVMISRRGSPGRRKSSASPEWSTVIGSATGGRSGAPHRSPVAHSSDHVENAQATWSSVAGGAPWATLLMATRRDRSTFGRHGRWCDVTTLPQDHGEQPLSRRRHSDLRPPP